jgi:hypothetical protein
MRYLTLFLLAGAMLGQWDSVGSRSQVLARLSQREHQPENPFCDHEACTVKHEVLGEYELPYKTRKAQLVVAASTDPHHDCHSCGPALSFFEFTQRGSKWELTDSQFAVTEWGQFGAAYMSGMTVAPLGDDIYGIFLVAGSTHQGYTDQFTRILARVQKEIRQVAEIQIGDDVSGSLSPGSSDWHAKLTVDPRGTGVHDLIVTSSGIRDGQKFRKIERYKFNGSEYVPAI